MKKMTQKQKNEVWAKIQWEGGFEYFITGSSFPEVTAGDFRAAYKKLVSAWRAMEELLGEPPEEDYLE